MSDLDFPETLETTLSQSNTTHIPTVMTFFGKLAVSLDYHLKNGRMSSHDKEVVKDLIVRICYVNVRLKSIEEEQGPNLPTLYHSDIKCLFESTTDIVDSPVNKIIPMILVIQATTYAEKFIRLSYQPLPASSTPSLMQRIFG